MGQEERAHWLFWLELVERGRAGLVGALLLVLVLAWRWRLKLSWALAIINKSQPSPDVGEDLAPQNCQFFG
jgi:hypothetical protein